MIEVLPVSVPPGQNALEPSKAGRGEGAFSEKAEGTVQKNDGEESFMTVLERYLGQDGKVESPSETEEPSSVKHPNHRPASDRSAARRFSNDAKRAKAASADGRAPHRRLSLGRLIKEEKARLRIQSGAGKKGRTILDILQSGQKGRYRAVSQHIAVVEKKETGGAKLPIIGARRHRDEAKKSGHVKNGTKGRRVSKLIKRAQGALTQRAPQVTKERDGVVSPEKLESRESGRTKTWQSWREHSFACERYESSIHRAETAVEMRAHSPAGKTGDDIFGEIVRQFTFVVKRGGGEARLVLKPPSLGELRLNIKLNNAEVNTSMVVENMAMRDLIVSKLTTLQESLLNQGFSLGSFNVEVRERDASEDTGGQEKSGVVSLGTGPEEADEAEQTRSPGLPWISTIVNITV
jgi:hypothetical protein